MDKKTLSIVSYITIIGWVIAYVSYNGKTDKSSLERFHLNQSLGLAIISIIFSILSRVIIGIVPSLGIIFTVGSLAIFILWIIGIINASKEEEKPLPLIGGLFNFNFIQ